MKPPVPVFVSCCRSSSVTIRSKTVIGAVSVVTSGILGGAFAAGTIRQVAEKDHGLLTPEQPRR